jgi:hypothetical protein
MKMNANALLNAQITNIIENFTYLLLFESK